MQIEWETPQHVAIVVEKNKADTWSLRAYLLTPNGYKERRSLGVFETYEDAASHLVQVWKQA